MYIYIYITKVFVRVCRKYYFGEEPAAAANGAPEDPGLNESFETATPHKEKK